MTIRTSRAAASSNAPAAPFFTPDDAAMTRDREEWDNEGGAERPSRCWLDLADALAPALHASDDSRKGRSDV